MAWVGGNEYLGQADMENNVTELWTWFDTNLGCTPNAVAAMAGNMQSESTVNPQLWEDRDLGNLEKGYGLVQWTPARKLIRWADEYGYDYAAGDTQCERIFWEFENDRQWISTRDYPMTFRDFLFSKESPYDLALAFLHNYERPKDLNQPQRGEQAEVWYTFLTGLPPPPRKRRGWPICYYLRPF